MNPKGRLAIVVLWLATLLRLWGLGAQSLWLDEAFSHLFARLPLDVAWQAMTVDAVHPPLYYFLLRPWLALAGESEFALRFPSAMAGVLTVALALRIGRAWFSARVGLWSAILLAVNPFHVWYSQEARMYSLLGLLSLATLVAFARALHTHRMYVWFALIAISAVAYVIHYFALFLPLIEFVFLLATFRQNYQILMRWARAQVIAALPTALWLIWLYSTAGGTFGIGWIPQPHAEDLLRTLWSFGMAYDGRANWLVVIVVLIWYGLLAMGVLRGRGEGEARALLALALALPLLTTFLLSLRRPTYVDRFFIGGLPAFLLLATAGLERLPRLGRWIVILILLSVGLWGVARFRLDAVFAKEGWREAATWIQAREQPGDALTLRQFQHVVPMRYYYRGALELKAVTLNEHTTPMEELAAGHTRLWLIARARHHDAHHLAWSEPYHPERDELEPAVSAWLAEHCAHETVAFPGLMVMSFDLASPVCSQ